MTQHAQFPQVYPALHHLPSVTGQIIANGARLESRIIDITDPMSDPGNPFADFGDLLNISYTRSWRLAWSVRLDLVALPWTGNNRADLYLSVLNFTRRITASEASEDLVRLFIPAGVANYVYTGSRVIHSQQARILIENLSGASVQLDADFWAKAW